MPIISQRSSTSHRRSSRCPASATQSRSKPAGIGLSGGGGGAEAQPTAHIAHITQTHAPLSLPIESLPPRGSVQRAGPWTRHGRAGASPFGANLWGPPLVDAHDAHLIDALAR